MSLGIFPASIAACIKDTRAADFNAFIARLAAAALLQFQPVSIVSHHSNARTFDFRALQAVQAFELFVRFGRGRLCLEGSSWWKGARTRRDLLVVGGVMLLDGG